MRTDAVCTAHFLRWIGREQNNKKWERKDRFLKTRARGKERLANRQQQQRKRDESPVKCFRVLVGWKNGGTSADTIKKVTRAYRLFKRQRNATQRCSRHPRYETHIEKMSCVEGRRDDQKRRVRGD